MTPGSQINRLKEGGAIDRTRPLQFRFDGKPYTGFAGDTLASALLANGVALVGRSFKYHRPRGVFSAGSEEPNALVQLYTGDRAVPNLRATQVWLHEGLEAFSQNAWPGLRYDMGAAAQLVSRMLAAGFYYKTFMWPKRAWKTYEKIIRRAAGLGLPPEGPDGQTYESINDHCDVLVVGAGPAGLSAALAVGRTGADVVLCDENISLGGSLAWEVARIEGQSSTDWIGLASDTLESAGNVRILTGATAVACHDHNLVLLDQIVSTPDQPGVSRRLIKLRAEQVVLATGAVERPLVFPGNDRPGIMLASAARRYIRQTGVRPGRRAVIVTNNDSAYATIADLQSAGIELSVVIDIRDNVADGVAKLVPDGVPLLTGHWPMATRGRHQVLSIDVRPAGDPEASLTRYPCDLVCVSGGWTPSLQLYSQAGGTLSFDDKTTTLVANDAPDRLRPAGVAAGYFKLQECITSGHDTGVWAAGAAGFNPDSELAAEPVVDGQPVCLAAGTSIPVAVLLAASQKSFVDLQNDVTVNDLALSVEEGFQSIEHVKRYTTTGMGTDQGKTSNVNAINIVSELTGLPGREIGHTTLRPPVSPVLFGQIAGDAKGPLMTPTRRTPFHAASQRTGVVTIDSGDWIYPRYYPRDGETMEQAIDREVRNTRENVGIIDMSTLGKADVKGPGALAFLERLYCNNLQKLGLERVRYSLMLREDGIVLDDGTVSRLGDDHFLITMTTAQSWRVWLHMEKLRQVQWRDLDVRITSVTDHWASLAVAGPHARKVLESLDPSFDVSHDAFSPASVRQGVVAGLPARVFRVSFSGELGYEINVPAGYADALWDRVMSVGEPFGLMPYGLEALDIMRIEKGHISIGTEIDGRTTPGDLGLGRMVSTTKDFLGKSLLSRPQLQSDERGNLVGLVPVDGATPIPIGAMVTGATWAGQSQKSQGYVTASIVSATLVKPIALAFVNSGHRRHGEHVWAVSPIANESVEVCIVPSHFYDPKGDRLRV